MNGKPQPKKNTECRACGSAYYQTEAARGSLFRSALTRAQKQGVRWLTFYQATEISPAEYRTLNDKPDDPPLRGYDAEYGLFSPDGQVTGRRSYGKTLAGTFFEAPPKPPAPPVGPPPEFERSAFCEIYRWTQDRAYGYDPASPCAG